MEAIRIIKEMRRATNGNYPRFAIFENVTGIFSSNHGEDFRVVLEEFVKIVEPRATMPPMPRGGWPYADCYVGDGWSIAYRTFDTQYWGKTIRDPVTGFITQRGTPQRRRRLYLTACFASECACKILFEREGLQGDHTQGESPWKGITGDAGSSPVSDDRNGNALITQCSVTEDNISEQASQYLFESHAQDARYKGPLPVCPIISAKYGTGGLNQPFIVEPTDENNYTHPADSQTVQGTSEGKRNN